MNNYRGLQLQLKELRELGYYSGSIKLKEYEIIAKLINIRDTYLKNPEYSFEENLKENLMYWLSKAGINNENHGFDELIEEEMDLLSYNEMIKAGINNENPSELDDEHIIEYEHLVKINNGTCIICYDTRDIKDPRNTKDEDKLFQLECHEKHILCKECIDQTFKCPIDDSLI